MKQEYTYAAAFVKSLEANMLTDADFDALINYNTEKFETFLRSKGYEGETVYEMLENEHRKTLQICLELCDDSDLYDTLIAENDFHNIKAVIKAVISGGSWEELIVSPTTIDASLLDKAVRTVEFSAIDESFSGVCKIAMEMYSKYGGQAMEMYIDKQQLLYMLEKSSGFVAGYVEVKALVNNLKIYLRSNGASKRLLENSLTETPLIDVYTLINSSKSKEEVLFSLGYQREYELYSESVTKFERYCDDMVTDYLKKAKTAFFDFDAVFGYFEGKITEIKNLRIIIYAKKGGMKEDEIRERLRQAYV